MALAIFFETIIYCKDLDTFRTPLTSSGAFIGLAMIAVRRLKTREYAAASARRFVGGILATMGVLSTVVCICLIFAPPNSDPSQAPSLQFSHVVGRY